MNKELIQLAKKGGNDAHLMLLDKINATDKKIDTVASDLTQKITETSDSLTKKLHETLAIAKENTPDLNKVLESVRGTQGIQGEKGDKGDTGEQGIQGINGIDGKDGKDGVNGIDGQNGTNGRDGTDGVNGKDGSPDTAEQIVEKLESLEDANRLDASAIKGLIDLIKTLMPQSTTRSGAVKQRIITKDLSASLDGVTKTFTIGSHFGIISVESDSAPFGAFRPTTDYTEDPRGITFTSQIDATVSLASGHSLIVRYLK